jgi:hypothetical protein
MSKVMMYIFIQMIIAGSTLDVVLSAQSTESKLLSVKYSSDAHATCVGDIGTSVFLPQVLRYPGILSGVCGIKKLKKALFSFFQ